ncbi:MAG: RES domain-containing protein [Spiribacter salinus]|uniref:RES domain-containing protein n=1 Tax=Spiribacter salinus TaxID=1335746 RepID=A0A540VNP4_9GAMM|nr:MAG: RES domain-containing protein [Spiribacter salinus]
MESRVQPSNGHPPDELSHKTLPIQDLSAGHILYRSHHTDLSPLYFSRGRRLNRFDDPSGGFGVCYCAYSPFGAFAETFLRQRQGDFIDQDELELRCLAEIEAARPLRIVLLYGPNLSKMGATGTVSTGPIEAAQAQAWSKAIHDHPDEPDGIMYRVRHDDSEMGVALFDRCQAAIRWADSTSWDHSALLNEICSRYDLIL